MILADQLQQLKDLVTAAHSLVIVLGPTASFDQVSTGLALSSALQASGKEVIVVCPQLLSQEYHSMVNVNQVRTELGHQNLLLSFPYQETAVDKVSYHIDEANQRFHLVIKPQRGAKPLDPQQIEYSYSGAEADLIWLIGVANLESLAQLYIGYEEFYQHTTTISLNTYETSYGSIKLNVGDVASMSEAMTEVLVKLELPVGPEAATTLLAGIEEATDHFSSLAVTAQTFETVASLLRAGARRTRRKPQLVPVTTEGDKAFLGGEVGEDKDNFASALSVTKKSNRRLKKNESIAEASPKPGDLKYQPSSFGPGTGG